MTWGSIFEIAYRLRAFQMWELIRELHKEHSYLNIQMIRSRVKAFLRVQMFFNVILKVSENPPIFTFSEFKDIWTDFLRYRYCVKCGKAFLPRRYNQKRCSSCAKRKKRKN